MASDQSKCSAWSSPMELVAGWPALRLGLGGQTAAGFAEWVSQSRHAKFLVVDLGDSFGKVRPGMLKLQSDDAPGVTVDLFGGQSGNQSVAQGLMDVGRATGGLVGVMLATTWCKVRDVGFRNFCPDTLQPLRTCRDDVLLGQAGLEPYTDGKVRYEAAECAGQARRFYSWSRDAAVPVGGKAVVRFGVDLYRDYKAVLQADWSDQQKQVLLNIFPCWTCPMQGECYAQADDDSAILAEERLVPIAYHEAVAQLLPGFTLSWSEASKILGGGTAAESCDRDLGSLGVEGALAESVRGSVDRLDGVRAWLTSGTSHGLRALGSATAGQLAREVAVLKLKTFQKVCTLVASFHQSTGKPHGDLGLRALRLGIESVDGLMTPARWLVHPVLWHHDVPSVVCAVTSEDTHHRVVVPSPDSDPAYRSPLVDASCFRGTAQGKLKSSPDTVGRGFEFLSAHTRFQGTLPGDIVQILVRSSARDSATVQVWGKVVDVKTGWLLLDFVDSSTIQKLLESRNGELAADLVTYQNYNTACDLWPLAEILTALLLVNDRRDFLTADSILRSLCSRLQAKIGVVPGSVDDLARSIVLNFKEVDSRELLEPFFLREQLRAAPIPKEIWLDLWVTVLRLATAVPGFSYATSYAEVAPMMDIIENVAALAQRLEVEAFGVDLRRSELAEVVTAQRQSLDSQARSTSLDSK